MYKGDQDPARRGERLEQERMHQEFINLIDDKKICLSTKFGHFQPDPTGDSTGSYTGDQYYLRSTEDSEIDFSFRLDEPVVRWLLKARSDLGGSDAFEQIFLGAMYQAQVQKREGNIVRGENLEWESLQKKIGELAQMIREVGEYQSIPYERLNQKTFLWIMLGLETTQSIQTFFIDRIEYCIDIVKKYCSTEGIEEQAFRRELGCQVEQWKQQIEEARALRNENLQFVEQCFAQLHEMYETYEGAFDKDDVEAMEAITKETDAFDRAACGQDDRNVHTFHPLDRVRIQTAFEAIQVAYKEAKQRKEEREQQSVQKELQRRDAVRTDVNFSRILLQYMKKSFPTLETELMQRDTAMKKIELAAQKNMTEEAELKSVIHKNQTLQDYMKKKVTKERGLSDDSWFEVALDVYRSFDSILADLKEDENYKMLLDLDFLPEDIQHRIFEDNWDYFFSLDTTYKEDALTHARRVVERIVDKETAA